jgi:hypothetical protein
MSSLLHRKSKVSFLRIGFACIIVATISVATSTLTHADTTTNNANKAHLLSTSRSSNKGLTSGITETATFQPISSTKIGLFIGSPSSQLRLQGLNFQSHEPVIAYWNWTSAIGNLFVIGKSCIFYSSNAFMGAINWKNIILNCISTKLQPFPVRFFFIMSQSQQ